MTTWTNVGDLTVVLRKRWATGRYLSDYAGRIPWTPVELPVRAPSASELLNQFDEAVRWAERFQRDSHTAGGVERFTVTYHTIKSKNLGENAVPARVRIENLDQLCALIGTASDVRLLDVILQHTEAAMPQLVSWVVANPLRAIRHQDIWRDVLSVVSWIATNSTKALYLRQMDVEGIDTKFIDTHRKFLDDLLTIVLPDHQIDSEYTATDFTRRFRFRPKPSYTRLRLLSPDPTFPKGLSEITLRTEELAALEITVDTIFVVENEISYLAFPVVPNSIVVFGSGFGLATLRDIPWLDSKEIVYWGDIDTHGFDILHRLRARFASVQSILMDHQTLLAHPQQWVKEPSPTNRALTNLTDVEEALYHDLIEDRYGQGVRLEQERVRFSLLKQALQHWTT